MFKRRRGVVVKCAALIASFWFGFAIYVTTVARTNDDGRSLLLATQAARENDGAKIGDHMVMPPTVEPPVLHSKREDDKARRDRDLQEQFRRDQTKLQQLLGGRKTPVLAATRAVNLQKYDPHTASLIRNGLIVPKWNLSEELPEHLGAPGIVCLIHCMHIP